MKQELYIQVISENKLDVYILRRNSKRVWISDDIWKNKLESCALIKELTGEAKCKRSIGLIGVVRGTF